MNFMYKITPLIICMVLIPAQLIAVVTPNNQDVRFTVHNLSYNPNDNTGSKGISDDYRNISANNPNATEVCIFCHTPHTSDKSSQLWNKASGSGQYAQPVESAYKLY